MDYLKLLSTIFSLLTTLLSATEKKSCSLKDLDITPQSSYVIYGIRHDGHAFSFTEADVHHARSTPDQYLNKITTELTTSNTAPSHFYSEITLTESNGVLHRILRRRSHNSNQLDADTNGIPHRSEFIYLGNRRSQLQTGATLTLFSIPETNHTRYYLKHSDEYGLHGGFLKLPYITVFEIKGRRMKDIKIRLKIMRRPDQFLYTDDSRLWNYGEDLNVTHIIDRLGKEWQFAFRTVNARGLCIASEGMPNLDLHILWRHNRRLRSVYNRTETKDNFLDEFESVLWGGPEFFKGVIFVGLRNGILFVCPAEERLVSVNQMFNEAGFYAKENPDMSDWRQSRRGEIYLLSQHFKEVFVVAVTEDALYYKVYPTSGDSFRAYTIDLKQFVRVPSLKLHLDGSPLLSMDLFDNLLYAFYKDQVWSVPIGREHYDEPKKENETLRQWITDTCTGERKERRYPMQLQLFNDLSTYMTESLIRYEMYEHGAIRVVDIARNHYDSVILLHRANYRTDERRPLTYGLKDCYLFASFDLKSLGFPKSFSAVGCIKSADVRMFYEKSHIIILMQKAGEENVYYTTRKVEFGELQIHWTTTLQPKQIWKQKRMLRIGKDSSLNMCYVEGYMLRCFVQMSERQRQDCTTRMKRISHNWFTNQFEGTAEMTLEQISGVNFLMTNSCNVTADYFYMKDGKDLIVRLPREAGGRYFSHNQLLWNQRSPNKLPCAKRGGSSEELNSHLLMSWSGDDVVTRVLQTSEAGQKYYRCEVKEKNQILMEDVQSIGGVHFVGMSRGLIEERADGMRRVANYTNAVNLSDVLRSAEPVRPFQDDFVEKIADDNIEAPQEPCNAWQKVAAITVLCIIGGEIALLLAAIAAVQFIAKPRIRRYKEQLGIVYKKKKRALKERALKRLRKLRMRKLRAKRRHLREQRRREEKGGSQSSSSSSSCSSCSFESTGFTKPTTLDARTGQRDGLQTNFNAQKTPQAEASKKNVADLVEAHEVSALAQQRRFGVDKTTTQAPEPTGDGTGMTRGANIHNSQLQQK